MNHSKSRKELAALRKAALEDLMAASDAQLQQEALEEGVDADLIASQVRSMMLDEAMARFRQRLAQAKERPVLESRIPKAHSRPPIDRIRQFFHAQFKGEPKFALKFREGKTQTDDDLLSLYDDLVALGAIDPNDLGD